MIKKKYIGANYTQKGVGTFLIKEGNEKLYKKLGLDIFEDEVKKEPTKPKRSTNTSGKDNAK